MLKKRFVKSRKVWKVDFELPKDVLSEAIEVEDVSLLGEFNDWDPNATPMKLAKDNFFRTAIELEPGQEYQFRYLVNGQHWFDDQHADGYVPNEFGGHNCLVTVPMKG